MLSLRLSELTSRVLLSPRGNFPSVFFFLLYFFLVLLCPVLALPLLIFVLLPLYHTGTSCNPSSNSTWRPRELQWYCDHHCCFHWSLFPSPSSSSSESLLFPCPTMLCASSSSSPSSWPCTSQIQAAIPAAFLHGALGRISGNDRSFHPFFFLTSASSLTCADPYSSASTCWYKLSSQQHFYTEPQGASLALTAAFIRLSFLLLLLLLSPAPIPLLLPLLAGTSCHPSSTSTWSPRALWYCLMRPVPSQ